MNETDHARNNEPDAATGAEPFAANPKALDQLEMRAVGEEWLVHDPVHEKVHVLNSTAAKILRMCDGAHGAKGIAEDVSAETGADKAQVLEDVNVMLKQFRQIGLLQ